MVANTPQTATAVGGILVDSYFTDPLGIHVTEAVDDVVSYPTAVCAQSPNNAAESIGDEAWHLDNQLSQWSGARVDSSEEDDCFAVSTYQALHYQNASFCNTLEAYASLVPGLLTVIEGAFGSGPTYQNYDSNTAAIYEGGLADASWTETLGGGCSNLLKPHHDVYDGGTASVLLIYPPYEYNPDYQKD